MKKITLTLLTAITVLTSYCQTNPSSSFNFGFEEVENGIPSSWSSFGSDDYKVGLDSLCVKSGKYSAFIECNGGNGYKALQFVLPNYTGKKITLSGYIKTEHVSDGFAGIWMRIDPEIAFDNMEKQKLIGTTDWTKYEISLDMDPEKTEQIVFGAVIKGKGKMWIDQFTITIDGKDLKDVELKLFPAQQDKEFDSGSGITTIAANGTQLENLRVLGLVWGFLKYYHPNIAKGNYNWDFELFRILPQVQNAENGKSRDEILLKWIESLGNYEQGKAPKVKSSKIKTEPDLAWISTSGFSAELTGSLLKIKHAKRPGNHYYIGFQAAENPDFKHEKAYASMTYPDAGFRLLALYRYWNMIQYYFPYKNLIEEDWKSVLTEFIPKVIAAENETEYVLTMLGIIGRIHDTHANIMRNNALNQHFGMNYAPLEMRFVENHAVVTNYHDEKLGKETGLKIGDIIIAVNNKPVTDLVEQQLKLKPASNYPTKLRDIARDLLRTNDSTISVLVLRNETEEKVVLKTFSPGNMNMRDMYMATDTSFRMIGNDIAYINNSSIQRDHLSKIWPEIAKSKGLIIDNRNYPSDFVLYDLCSYLMPKRMPFVKFSSGSITNPGLFTFGEPVSAGRKNKTPYKGRVIILVNEVSQSSSEFHAMAYRAYPNATVVGSTTAGADGNVSEIYLPGNIMSWISGIGVYYPDGQETQRFGIVPDVFVQPTIRGIREGRDEVLEKAIQLIKGI
jgi:C-terminal processing protease CtpA/Prc